MRDCLNFMTFSVHPHGIFSSYAVSSQTASLQCLWFILSISQFPDPIICFSGYFLSDYFSIAKWLLKQGVEITIWLKAYSASGSAKHLAFTSLAPHAGPAQSGNSQGARYGQGACRLRRYATGPRSPRH